MNRTLTRRRRRTIRTRVASRRHRPVYRLTTSTGYRPLPLGLTIPAGCPVDRHALELVTAGTASPREARAVVRCPECRGKWLLTVTLTPATHAPRTAIQREQLDLARPASPAARTPTGRTTAGPVHRYLILPLAHTGPVPADTKTVELTAAAAHNQRKTYRRRGLTLLRADQHQPAAEVAS